MKAVGFGSRFWAQRIQDVLPTDAIFTDVEELDKIEPVAAEIIVSIRLDEAMKCRAALADAGAKATAAYDALTERIRIHNAARRKRA